ncbi:hypothetical protein [Phenylobacterium sp.]|uniref:hypothetical protein n=1 Tax=Phenylobacterium sp. TaxID=1871053 RepID=UPI002F429894
MSACAYRLGMAFGGEAERAEAAAVKLEYFRLFDRCFFAVRVATALELRLRRAPVAGGAAAGKAAGPGDERLERAEAERAESEDAEPETAPAEGRYAEEGDRDREREAEPASLPVLLRTLGEVAADAAALPGPPPADLPTLRELLTHVGSGGGPASARSPERSSAAGLRARLAGSATAVALAPRPPVQPGGTAGKLATRRATGPPGR